MTPSTSLSSVLVSIVSFIVLDGLWLGLVMTNFYRTQLMGIGRIVDGVFAPVWAAAAPVYLLLGIGVAVFVVPRAASASTALALGALFGLVVYGVYDLTNYSTLTNYPLRLTIVDMLWGAVACGTVALIAFSWATR
ncbi:MAG: DUF2177 family protein [Vicinamibacterales bacterium]